MAQSARTGRFKISRSKTLPASRRERAEVTYNKDLKQNERETRNYVDGWSTDSMHLSDDLNLINSNDNSTEAVDRGPRSNETSSSDLNVAKYLKSASELALEVGEHQQSDLEVNLPNLEVTCVTVDDGELRQGLHPYYTPPRVDSSSFHDNVAQPQDNFDSTDESERDILITIIGEYAKQYYILIASRFTEKLLLQPQSFFRAKL